MDFQKVLEQGEQTRVDETKRRRKIHPSSGPRNSWLIEFTDGLQLVAQLLVVAQPALHQRLLFGP